MWIEWYEVSAEVELVSPLHIGNGNERKLDARRDQDQDPYCALTQTDAEGYPYIPGSTLKGLLREHLKFDQELRDELFGAVKKKKTENSHGQIDRETFTAAKVTFSNARMAQGSAIANGPFSNEPMPEASAAGATRVTHGKRGLAIRARTAIHSGRGTADDGKLFFEQYVPAGSRFTLRFRLNGSHDDETVQEKLGMLLAPFATDDGLNLGGGSTYGHGRIRLVEPNLNATRFKLNPISGTIEPATEQIEIGILQSRSDTPIYSADLILKGRGPFIVVDSSRGRKQSRSPDTDETPQIVPLADPRDDSPVLPGESLYGVLRKSAVWKKRLEDRNYSELRSSRPEGDTSTPVNGSELAITDKLFGCNGWRGLIDLGPIECVSSSAQKKLVSVKLDRFSMAPIDGGLFETQVFVDPEFRLRITLRNRAGALVPEDRDWFARFIDDLCREGIEVGHGAAKGFGWFDVEKATTQEDPQ